MTARGDRTVADLLLQRRASGATYGRRSDGAVIALVCATGGMRGVIAGGMVTGLERLGLLNTFDIYCGASAGAFAICYFCAGQAALGTSIYAEDLSGSRFIDARRLFSGRPMMDLDYLVDTVTVSVKPLDTAILLRRPEPILLVATDALTGHPLALRGFQQPEEVRAALRASARIPLIGGDPVVIDGRPLIDGGLANPIPVEAVLAAGATHMLVLVTSPLGQAARPRPGLVSRMFAWRLKRRFGAPVLAAFVGRETAYAGTIEQIESGSVTKMRGSGTAVGLVVGPGGTEPPLSRFCTDAPRLHQGALAGERAIYEVFDENEFYRNARQSSDLWD